MTQNRSVGYEVVLGVICRVLFFESNGLGQRTPSLDLAISSGSHDQRWAIQRSLMGTNTGTAM
jgi:hypothetical protein